MDEVIVSCYCDLREQYNCSVDDILIEPYYRNLFLKMVALCFVDDEEKVVLKRLVNLRKQSKLPRIKSLRQKNE